tara:strand:- start:1569 stop:3242 length:1674 start_codon:yes stop_codon:yes gene_type:complete
VPLGENIAKLVSSRDKDLGELEEEQLAKNKFRRDVIPSPGTALPGMPKQKKLTATVQGVERSRLLSETKIIQDLMEKMYPWLYKKPADEKGQTKIAERVTKDAKDAEERKTSVKKTVSTLGKILGAIALLTLGWTLFKDKIKELWGMFKGWIGKQWEAFKTKMGELFNKVPGLFKLALRGLLAAPLLALKIAVKGVKLAVKLLLSPLKGMLGILKGLGKAIVAPIKLAITGLTSIVGGIAKIFGAGVKPAAQAGGKVAAKAAEAAAKKKAAQSAGKSVGKSLLKKIPGVGLLAGIGFGIMRAAKGDFAGAGLEIASGAASTIPGAGTAASVAIDVGLAARDIKKAAQAANMEDGIINPDGGLLVQGRKGMFKLAKTDSVIAGELPNAGRKDSALSKIGHAMLGPLSPIGKLLSEPIRRRMELKKIITSERVNREKFDKSALRGLFGSRREMPVERVDSAKQFTNYIKYQIKGDAAIASILKKSDKTLEQIERNTRGGMGGPTIIPPGQQNSPTPANNNNQNSVAPNLNVNTGGSKKLDSRVGYINSAYSVSPNSLIT